MLSGKDMIRPLTLEELAKIQASDPETTVRTLDEQQLAVVHDAWSSIVKEEYEKAEKYPILKRTEESKKLFSYRNVLKRYQYEFNEELEYLPLAAAICDWLYEFEEKSTCLKYAECITDMISKNIIHEQFADGKVFTVGDFRHVNHERALEYIKTMPDWTEHARQTRAACYISLTAYLHKISNGWFRRAFASNTEANKTFYRLNPKIVKQALSLEKWHTFLEHIYEENLRDSFIARCMLYGGHRASAILNLKYEQIDFEKNIIRFARGGKKGLELPILYPAQFMQELKTYLQTISDKKKESGFVFITRTGKPLTRSRLNYSFAHASEQVGIDKISPEILRATWFMLNQENLVDDMILSTKRYNFTGRHKA